MLARILAHLSRVVGFVAFSEAGTLLCFTAAAAGLDSTFDPTAAINAAITQAAQANGNAAVNNAAVRLYGSHTPCMPMPYH